MQVHNILQEVVIKTIPEIQKAKWLSDKALQIAEKEEEQKVMKKRKDIPILMHSSKE